jgi:hypothetical protein
MWNKIWNEPKRIIRKARQGERKQVGFGEDV